MARVFGIRADGRARVFERICVQAHGGVAGGGAMPRTAAGAGGRASVDGICGGTREFARDDGAGVGGDQRDF